MESRTPSDNSCLRTSKQKRSRFSASKLLAEIEGRVLSGPEASTDPEERIRILQFGYRYFSHHCEHPPSTLHSELTAALDKILSSRDSERLAVAAPRGSAKTTWVSMILIIYCIVHGLKKYIVLISNTSSLANSLVRDIQHELEENEDLRRDFAHACGRGPTWREDELVTNNHVKVLGLGAGKRIRGRKFRQHRPDLIVLDDLENDEQVRNPEQRDKLSDWMNKAVLHSKGLAKKADVLVVGTILHFDSVLARLLDVRKSPGWRSMKYRSVIQYSDRPDLWERWEGFYTDYYKPTDERQRDALAFYEENEEDMLRGTKVLWPGVESYYDLMRHRIDHGPIAFDSEKQNEPIDPSSCIFPESWFEWFDVEEVGGETWLVPRKGERVKLSDCDMYGAVDPSMGKNDKHRDPSAIVTIAAYPAGQSGKEYSSFWVLDADIRRRHPHVIQRDILDLHRQRRFLRFGIEAVQFQELFADEVQQAAPDLHTVKLNPLGDKKLRIEKLSALIYNGRLRFHRKLTALYDQLRYWPQAAHDDGPDAVELCMQTINREGWRFLDVGSVGDDDRQVHPYQQQLLDVLPYGTLEVPSETCRTCIHFKRRHDGKTMCDVDQMLVDADEMICDFYDFSPMCWDE